VITGAICDLVEAYTKADKIRPGINYQALVVCPSSLDFGLVQISISLHIPGVWNSAGNQFVATNVPVKIRLVSEHLAKVGKLRGHNFHYVCLLRREADIVEKVKEVLETTFPEIKPLLRLVATS